MKFFNIKFLLIITLFSASLFANEDAQIVSLEPDLFSNQAGHVIYEFQLIDLKNKTLIKDSDLTIENEKILHLITYDSALKEFQHLHPTYSGKNWVIEFDMKKDGDYWIWAQGDLTSSKTKFSSSNKLSIMGGTEANPVPAKLVLTRSGNDSVSAITLSNSKITAKKAAMLDIKFTRTDGASAEITKYLGAMAHIIAVNDTGDSITHVHVMDSSKANEGMIHATFKTAGQYRLWIQFMDNNILRTVPLAIQVY